MATTSLVVPVFSEFENDLLPVNLKIIILAAVIITRSSCFGQSTGPAVFIKDINNTPSSSTSNYALGEVNGKILYSLTTAFLGEELYASASAGEVPQFLKDLAPGSGGSAPRMFTSANTRTYFIASAVDYKIFNAPVKLWYTDGTATGTMEVPLPASVTSVTSMSALADGLVFYATTSDGTSVYYTDGSSITLLSHQSPFALLPNNSYQQYRELNGSLYYMTLDGESFFLWKTDGTQAGTVQLTTNGATAHKGASVICAFNNILYFWFNESLWQSDGTVTGTVPVSGRPFTSIGNPIFHGNKMFFTDFGDQLATLWSLDTSGNATGILTGNREYFSILSSLDDGCLFTYRPHYPGTTQIWFSNGTDTHFVDSLYTENSSFEPSTACEFSGQVLIKGYSPKGLGVKSWAIGKNPGSAVLAPTPQIPAPNMSDFFKTAQGLLWFTGNQFGGRTTLYFYSGGANTREVQIPDPTAGSVPSGFIRTDKGVFFGASTNANNYPLWRTLGDSATTTLLTPGASDAGYLVHDGNVILFSGNDTEHNGEPWISNGTASGTHLLTDLNAGAGSSYPNSFAVYKNKIVFNAYEDGVQEYLYAYDTVTKVVAKLVQSARPLDQIIQTTEQGIYYIVYSSSTDYTLMRTDGTAEGTKGMASFTQITAFSQGLNDKIGFQLGDKFLFLGYDYTSGYEIRTLNTSTNQVSLLKDINQSTGYEPAPYLLCLWNNDVYFAADDGVHGTEFWVTDGTETGTHMVKDINPGMGNSVVQNAIVYGDRIYFSATDGVHGLELWSSQGTDATTKLVMDFVEGPADSNPTHFFVTHDRLLFSTENKTLWEIIGNETPPAKVNLGVIFEEQQILRTFRFFEFDDLILFSGKTTDTGEELWALDYRSQHGAVSFSVPDQIAGTAPFNLLPFLVAEPSAQFRSSDSTVLSISGDMAKARKAGSVTITAFIPGSSTMKSISASSTVQVTEAIQGLEPSDVTIAFYPNPTDGNITVHVSSATATTANLKIIDILGKPIESRIVNTNGDNTFDLHQNGNGIYFIKVQVGNTVIHQRIIKK